MDTTAQVEKFLRDNRRKNRLAIILAILALPLMIGTMLFVVLTTDDAPVGSLRFFGLLLLIMAILFYIGMMGFVASPRGDLSSHPARNFDYWATEMLRQAKLLRRAPLWTLGPFVPGFALQLWPTEAEVDLKFVVSYSVTHAVAVLWFAVVTWVSLREASKLTLEASSLKDAQANHRIQPMA